MCSIVVSWLYCSCVAGVAYVVCICVVVALYRFCSYGIIVSWLRVSYAALRCLCSRWVMVVLSVMSVGVLVELSLSCSCNLLWVAVSGPSCIGMLKYLSICRFHRSIVVFWFLFAWSFGRAKLFFCCRLIVFCRIVLDLRWCVFGAWFVKLYESFARKPRLTVYRALHVKTTPGQVELKLGQNYV